MCNFEIMALHQHALMADLRAAIRHSRVIRFTYEGRNYEVEPHDLRRDPVTGIFELTAWVRRHPNGKAPAWAQFQYWKMRGIDLMPDKFLPRLAKSPAVALAG